MHGGGALAPAGGREEEGRGWLLGGGKSVFSFFLRRLVLEINAYAEFSTFYFYKILISFVDLLQCTH